MNQKPIGKHIVLRYVYAMLVIIVIAVTAVTVSLFVIQNDNRVIRDRIGFFHLESTLESEKLARETETLHDLLVAPSTSDQSISRGAAGVSGAKIGRRGLLHSMRSRIERLSALQDQYDSVTIASTLQRLIDQFERIDKKIRAPVIDPESVASIAALRLTIRQFDRLHAISIDNELRKLAEKQKQAPRFFGALSIGMGFSVIAVLYLITSLRSSLARQRKAETDLAEAREHLHQTRKLEALGQLVGGVAHEFNNSLTSILGHAELLLDKSTGNDNVENGLEEIRTAGLHAASLTQQLLGFSGQQHANRSVLDLNDLIRNLEEKLQQMVASGIKLTCAFVDGPYPVELDPDQVHQVLTSLISNAIDATPEGGAISVETENVTVNAEEDGVPAGEYLRLTVSDNGVGMDEDTRQRLFEPFFTTKEDQRATGLGLSLVHGIVADSNGFITVDSQKNRGTHVHLYFPRAVTRAEASTNQSATHADRGSETILVVDDDAQIRRFVEKGLSSLGYRVLTASGGAAGIQICEKEDSEIHAIVSDIIMSETSGPVFMANARRLRPDAATVYISGYTEDAVMWRSKGLDDTPLITKPFEIESLNRVLRERLDHVNATQSA